MTDVDQVKRVQLTWKFFSCYFQLSYFSFRLQLEIFRLTFELCPLFQLFLILLCRYFIHSWLFFRFFGYNSHRCRR